MRNLASCFRDPAGGKPPRAPPRAAPAASPTLPVALPCGPPLELLGLPVELLSRCLAGLDARSLLASRLAHRRLRDAASGIPMAGDLELLCRKLGLARNEEDYLAILREPRAATPLRSLDVLRLDQHFPGDQAHLLEPAEGRRRQRLTEIARLIGQKAPLVRNLAVGPPWPEDVVEYFPTLHDLSIEQLTPGAVQRVATMSGLRRLSCRLASPVDVDITALQRLPELVELDLGLMSRDRLAMVPQRFVQAGPVEAGHDAAAQVGALTQLRALKVSLWAGGEEAAGAAIAPLCELTSLHLECDYAALREDWLAAGPPLRELEVRPHSTFWCADLGLKPIVRLTGLTRLCLHGPHWPGHGSAQSLAGIAALGALRSADLFDETLTHGAFEILAGLPVLTSLRLVRCEYTPADFLRLGAAPSLERLHVGEVNLAGLGDPWRSAYWRRGRTRHFSRLTALTATALSWAGNDRFEALAAGVIRKLVAPPCLVDVELGENNIDVRGLRALAGASGLTRLCLGGPGTRVSGDVRQLSALGRLARLEILQAGLTADHGRQLARLTQLTSLSIAGNGLGDVGAAHLSALRRLGRLDLGGNGVGPATLRALSSLTRLSSLSVDRWGAEDHERARGSAHRDGRPGCLCGEDLQELRRLPALTSVSISGHGITQLEVYRALGPWVAVVGADMPPPAARPPARPEGR